VNRFVSGGAGAYYTAKLTFSNDFSHPSLGCVLYKCAYYIRIFTVSRNLPAVHVLSIKQDSTECVGNVLRLFHTVRTGHILIRTLIGLRRSATSLSSLSWAAAKCRRPLPAWKSATRCLPRTSTASRQILTSWSSCPTHLYVSYSINNN